MAQSESLINPHQLECFESSLRAGTHSQLLTGPLSFGSEAKEAFTLPELATICCPFTDCSPRHADKGATCSLSSPVCFLAWGASDPTGPALFPQSQQEGPLTRIWDRIPGKRHLQFGKMVSREPGIGQVRGREMIRRYRLHGRQEDFHGRHGREKERRML